MSNQIYFSVHRANIEEEWTTEELAAAYGRLFKAGSRTAVIYDIHMYNLANKFGDFTEPPKVLPDRFMLDISALVFQPNHMFYEVVDETMQRLAQNGVTEYHVKTCYEKFKPERFRKKEESYKILTLSELEAGFVVSLVPLILSFLVFCIEWLPSIKNIVMVGHIFKAFYRLR